MEGTAFTSCKVESIKPVLIGRKRTMELLLRPLNGSDPVTFVSEQLPIKIGQVIVLKTEIGGIFRREKKKILYNKDGSAPSLNLISST